MDVYRVVVSEEQAEWPEQVRRHRRSFTGEEPVLRMDDVGLAKIIERERVLLLSGIVV